jgi:hypothetical protein
VSLDPAFEGLVWPSKIYGIEAAGRPWIRLRPGLEVEDLERAAERMGTRRDPPFEKRSRARLVDLLTCRAVLPSEHFEKRAPTATWEQSSPSRVGNS